MKESPEVAVQFAWTLTSAPWAIPSSLVLSSWDKRPSWLLPVPAKGNVTLVPVDCWSWFVAWS